jgi:nucleolar pre-ribosomal-associated protein 1
MEHRATRPQMLSLHGAPDLLEPMSEQDPVQVWGEGVEALWRITMTLESKTPTWDALTCRLLLWRAIVGEDGSAVGEWARKEVVRNLGMQ